MAAKKKSATNSLIEQLSKVATDGPAGAAQATRAKQRPPKAPVSTPSSSPKEPPVVSRDKEPIKRPPAPRVAGPKGKTVSCYLHHDELSALESLGARLTLEKGTTANRTHLLRAGIRAISLLPMEKLAEIVEEEKLLDGRKNR